MCDLWSAWALFVLAGGIGFVLGAALMTIGRIR